MIFVVDAGNTKVKVTIYQDDKTIIYQDSVLTIRENSSEYYQEFFKKINLLYPNIKGYIISSVVPAITNNLYDILKGLYHQDGLIVNAELVTDLVIHLKDRNELGADYIATIYGALAKYPAPIIIVDFGTATKYSVINEKKEFEGGIIAPGITITNQAIQLTIPHLPKVEPFFPNKMLNEKTEECIQAGLMYGTLYQTKGICEGLEEELKIKATKIITGGYGRYFVEKAPEFVYEENLLEDGIFEIYQKYHKK